MIQAKFLLEVLIVPFDPPAQFGAIDQCLEKLISAGKVDSQYLVGPNRADAQTRKT